MHQSRKPIEGAPVLGARIVALGLISSIIGVCSVMLIGETSGQIKIVAAHLFLLSPLGFLLSVSGWLMTKRKIAVLGITLGFFGSVFTSDALYYLGRTVYGSPNLPIQVEANE